MYYTQILIGMKLEIFLQWFYIFILVLFSYVKSLVYIYSFLAGKGEEGRGIFSMMTINPEKRTKV